MGLISRFTRTFISEDDGSPGLYEDDQGAIWVRQPGEAASTLGDGGSVPEGGSVENVLALQEVTETIEVTVLYSDLTGWASDGGSDPGGGYAAGAFTTDADFTGKRVTAIDVEVVTPFSTGGIDTNDWAELKFGDTTLGDWTTDQGSTPWWYVYVDANVGNSPGTPSTGGGILPLSVDGLLSGLILADLGTAAPDAGEVTFTFTVTSDPATIAPAWEDVTAVLDALPLLPATAENKDGSPLVTGATGAQWRQDGYAGARRATINVDSAGTWRAAVMLPKDIIITCIVWHAPGSFAAFASALLEINSPQNSGGAEPWVTAFDLKADNSMKNTFGKASNLVGGTAVVKIEPGGDVVETGPDTFIYGPTEVEVDFDITVTGSGSGTFEAFVLFQVIGAESVGALLP